MQRCLRQTPGKATAIATYRRRIAQIIGPAEHHFGPAAWRAGISAWDWDSGDTVPNRSTTDAAFGIVPPELSSTPKELWHQLPTSFG
jgi:hypothetical protein